VIWLSDSSSNARATQPTWLHCGRIESERSPPSRCRVLKWSSLLKRVLRPAPFWDRGHRVGGLPRSESL